MKITYDDIADASYIYFTSIDVGGVAETFIVEMSVEVDKDEQIASIRLCESDECRFEQRLEFVLQHRAVTYDATRRQILISFTPSPEVKGVISWSGNLDLDDKGRIVGLEILFAPADYQPDDGWERLSAKGRLKHLGKYLVPFDELY